MTIPLLRSALYLPASNARALAKARTLACDMVILDLEDAVAPAAKADARARAVAAAGEGGFGHRALMIRANALDTPWGADDLAALADAPAVLLPKIDGVADVQAARDRLGEGPALWAMVETCRAALDIGAIAGSGLLAGLVMGINDLAKEMRATQDVARAPFLGFLATSVSAARAHGIAILDGVYNDIADEAGFAAQCAQGAAFGCDGKTLIHPRQIEPCNAAFGPSARAIDEARAIVDAFVRPEHRALGAIKLDGRMVERLHLDEARAMLARADEVARRARSAESPAP